MKKPSIVQLNNQYIKDENQRQRFLEEENQKKNRFMGWILIVIMLLFILPTYNLIKSYAHLQDQHKQVTKLTKDYNTLTSNTKSEQEFANRLKNEDYVKKYARAKYYLSKKGETIYPIPSLLPK